MGIKKRDGAALSWAMTYKTFQNHLLVYTYLYKQEPANLDLRCVSSFSEDTRMGGIFIISSLHSSYLQRFNIKCLPEQMWEETDSRSSSG